jgi:hypothetical protein
MTFKIESKKKPVLELSAHKSRWLSQEGSKTSGRGLGCGLSYELLFSSYSFFDKVCPLSHLAKGSPMEYQKIPYDQWKNPINNVTYFFYHTKDNSISVSLKSSEEDTELMHSVDGAFSETVYLYEDIVKYALEQNIQNPVFLSLGLGLGYVEILVCCALLKQNSNQNITVFSYEKKEDLTNFFRCYFMGQDIPKPFFECYEDILSKFATHYDLPKNSIFDAVKKRLFREEILLKSSFHQETKIEKPLNGLFFDAFSIKTSPDLWEEELIRKILGSCAPKASFATYACRSLLKSLLCEYQFTLHKKKGYGGKKQSTFATR